MTTNIRFDDLLSTLHGRAIVRPASEREGDLKFLTKAETFIAQTVTADRTGGSRDPCNSDVLLFRAAAAVGKSTFAKQLAAASGIPFLDLATIKVGQHSLRGAMLELGDAGPAALREGRTAVVIDSLDEGRILSNDGNFEAFLQTTFQFLEEGAGIGGRPKALFFGRPEAIDLTVTALGGAAPRLTSTVLTVDFFDRAAATELILATVRVARTERGRADPTVKYDKPIRDVAHGFFDAISAAIGIPAADLWTDLRGRSFAGYAPVLTALGRLIADETENYQAFFKKLRKSGESDTWDVLEQVVAFVLAREATKLRNAVAQGTKNPLPAEAYAAKEQAVLLGRTLAVQTEFVTEDLRKKFASPEDLAAYRNAVRQQLPEHPFIRSGHPANDVLGAYIVADALARGSDLTRGKFPALLEQYGRQPFLWRFARRHLSAATDLNGGDVPYLLGSLASDPLVTKWNAVLEPVAADEAMIRLTVHLDAGATVVATVYPDIRFLGEIRDTVVKLPAAEVSFGPWPSGVAYAVGQSQTFRIGGTVAITAAQLRFDVAAVRIGDAGKPATLQLVADVPVNDQKVRVEMVPESRLAIGGGFVGRHPWAAEANEIIQPDDMLGAFLAECARRMGAKGYPVYVLPGFEPSDVDRFAWAATFGDRLRSALKLLVEHRLATSAPIGASGKERKFAVRPNVLWADLSRAYQNSRNGTPEVNAFLDALRAAEPT